LLIHSTALDSDGIHNIGLGYGALTKDVDEIVSSLDKEYTVVYRNRMLPGNFAKLDIPWPDELLKGNVKFSWTLVINTPTNPLHSDSYTRCGAMVTLHPNSNKYRFSAPAHLHKRYKIVDIVKNADSAEELTNAGWIKSEFPISQGPRSSWTEEDLRREMKWDTVEHRNRQFRGSSVENPCFHIHALERNNLGDRVWVEYALILTIQAPKADIDIYNNIKHKFELLAPLELKSREQILLRT